MRVICMLWNLHAALGTHAIYSRSTFVRKKKSEKKNFLPSNKGNCQWTSSRTDRRTEGRKCLFTFHKFLLYLSCQLCKSRCAYTIHMYISADSASSHMPPLIRFASLRLAALRATANLDFSIQLNFHKVYLRRFCFS